jgi:SAM-dependent methyltransferase
VRAFWHPVSAIYLDRPRVLASPAVVRLVLAGEGRATIVYAGDRMWPAIRHGQPLVVTPLAAASPSAGDLVLTVEDGVPDVLRVAADRSVVAADADPAAPRRIAAGGMLGRIEPARPRRTRFASLARAVLDVREAAAHRPDPAQDPAQTVRSKYDGQAVHYNRLPGDPLEPALASRFRAAVPAGGRVLVAGSGAGREAFALEQLGYEVSGVDFSQRMVAAAGAEAARRGSRARFAAADLRDHDEGPGSLAAVLFTYDVYSFIPGSESRKAVLAKVARWLVPGGTLFLSARRLHGAWDRVVLALQWLAQGRNGGGTWGDSHTRWLDDAGELRRSYVHVFSDRGLRHEVASAGFRFVSWDGGHGVYRAPDTVR